MIPKEFLKDDNMVNKEYYLGVMRHLLKALGKNGRIYMEKIRSFYITVMHLPTHRCLLFYFGQKIVR